MMSKVRVRWVKRQTLKNPIKMTQEEIADDTLKLLGEIQSDLADLRKEMRQALAKIHAQIDSLKSRLQPNEK